MTRPPNQTRFRDCEQVAEEVIQLYQRKLGRDLDAPIPIENIADNVCNLRIDSIDMKSIGKDISGALFKFDNQVLINDSDKYTRNRFTLAHEIAHWALEKHQMQNQGELTNDAEDLADRIAGALLMPERLISRHLEKSETINQETIENLAGIFQVSKYAILVRIIYLYENAKRFEDKIDWISLTHLKNGLQKVKEQVLKGKQGLSDEETNLSDESSEIKPIVEKLDNYPDSLKVVIETMATKGIGTSFRSDRRENISVTVQSPAKKLDRPFFIELAGPPNAGKDTQSKILIEYFRNIRGYKAIEIQETYSKCTVEGLELYQRYLWALLETIKTLLYDRPTRFDVVIINRGIFDLLAMLNFHYSQNHCTAKERKAIADFLLLPIWRQVVDVIFLMPINPQHSIEREEEEQRKTVAALAHSFDPLSIPKPPQRIVNENILSQLNDAYKNAYQQYGKLFNRIHVLEDVGSLSVEETARSLLEKIYDNMPPQKDSSQKVSSSYETAQNIKGEAEDGQLPLL